MNYNECLSYLDALGRELHGVKFRLEGIITLLASLGHPEKKYPTAIVAGTNGKGSTSAILASILKVAGYRTGLYTSPHLVRVNERIRVNEEEISDQEFAASFTEVCESVERLFAEKVLSNRLSFFEVLTATAFVHFARSAASFVVLEVGMGGRLDATNVTEPRIAVITSVDLDHQEFLGATLTEIATEKAGVIKPSRPVVSACEQQEAIEVIRRRSAELGAELLETPSLACLSGLRNFGGRYAFDLSLNGNRFCHLQSPLIGRFQVKNTVTAATAAWRLAQEGFDIPQEAIIEGVHQAQWPGRLEVAHERPLVLLDGAHNPAAAQEVASYIRDELAGRNLRLVYASMRDKAIGEICRILFPLAQEVYLTRPGMARAATPEEILAVAPLGGARIVLEPCPARALDRAFRASAPEDVILVLGSLFLVGEVKRAILEGTLKIV